MAVREGTIRAAMAEVEQALAAGTDFIRVPVTTNLPARVRRRALVERDSFMLGTRYLLHWIESLATGDPAARLRRPRLHRESHKDRADRVFQPANAEPINWTAPGRLREAA